MDDPWAGVTFIGGDDPWGDAVPEVPPQCVGCGEPVPWRERQWRTDLVEPGVEDGLRVVVAAQEPPWHGACERRTAWLQFRREAGQLARDGVLVVRAGWGLAGLAVTGWVAARRGAAEPVVRPRAGIARAGDELVRVYRLEARRRWRRLPIERSWRVVGEGVGAVVATAIHVGAQAARVVERTRFGWTDRLDHAVRLAREVGAGRLGGRRAWRELRDGARERSRRIERLRGFDPQRTRVGPVVAVDTRRQPRPAPGQFGGPTGREAAAAGPGSWEGTEQLLRAFGAGDDVVTAEREQWLRRTGTGAAAADPEQHGGPGPADGR